MSSAKNRMTTYFGQKKYRGVTTCENDVHVLNENALGGMFSIRLKCHLHFIIHLLNKIIYLKIMPIANHVKMWHRFKITNHIFS